MIIGTEVTKNKRNNYMPVKNISCNQETGRIYIAFSAWVPEDTVDTNLPHLQSKFL